MALSPPNKIVLKSTTRLSLNERFSAYRKQAETSAVAIRQRLHQTLQQNSKNWRLIQQMENRPSVIAALKLKKKSLKQRLGQPQRKSVKERLSLGVIRGGRLGVRSPRFTAGLKNRLNRRGKLRGRKQPMGTRNALTTSSPWSSVSENSRLQGRLGVRIGQVTNFSEGNGARSRLGRGLEFRRGRGGSKRGRSAFQNRGQFFSPKFRSNSNTNKRRGQNRGQARGGGGRGKLNAVPSRQTLDNELDEYMSRTKGNLDMELDSYMAQANLE